MFARIFKAAFCFALLSLGSGCVEGVAIVTLNPDGSGKVEVDFYGQGDEIFGAGIGGKKDKEPTLNEKKLTAVTRTLTGSPGITAWKDVKAEWSPDGRLHFVGTLYFDNIADLKDKFLLGKYKFARDKDGIITLAGDPKEDAEKKPIPNIAKMTEKELDDFIMSERIKYQSAKPIFMAMLSDLKYKTVFRLPGDASDVSGFKKTGDKVVTHEVDGNALLADLKKFMAQDDAAFKKFFRESKTPDIDLDAMLGAKFGMKPSVTVRKPDAAQFDYAKEVKAAIEAYPNLKKQLGLADTVALPGEKGANPPKFKN